MTTLSSMAFQTTLIVGDRCSKHNIKRTIFDFAEMTSSAVRTESHSISNANSS
jgi:hypothetical protein